MRSIILGAALAALILPATAPALADPPRQDHDGRFDRDGGNRDGQGRDRGRDERHDERRDDRGRNGGGRVQARGGDWGEYRNYDWNRPDRRSGGYDAARYYRAGSGYQERRLGRNDRLYRGNDGRYYCRRTDGTTGLIVGGVAGGVLGNVLANGQSSTLLTLLGAGGGALLGRSVDRGQVRCR